MDDDLAHLIEHGRRRRVHQRGEQRHLDDGPVALGDRDQARDAGAIEAWARSDAARRVRRKHARPSSSSSSTRATAAGRRPSRASDLRSKAARLARARARNASSRRRGGGSVTRQYAGSFPALTPVFRTAATSSAALAARKRLSLASVTNW